MATPYDLWFDLNEVGGDLVVECWISHGPRAGGQHTVKEWVSIEDMVRVAHLYALTAVLYCGG